MWDNYFYIAIENPQAKTSWFKDYGSIIGNIITIALFIIAFYRDKRKESKKEGKTKTEKLRYLASLVNSSLKTAKSNCLELEETIIFFINEPLKFHLIKWTVYYDIKRIVDKLNLEDYYIAYITQFDKRKDNIVIYQRMITSLDTLFEMFNELIKQAERASTHDFERKKIINVLGDEIHILIEKILSLTETLQMPEAFKEELKNPIDKWLKEKNKGNIKLFLETLCKPLFEIISTFNFQNNSKVPEEFSSLIEKLRNVVLETDFIKSGNLEYAESLKKQYIEINKTIESLETNSIELRKYLEDSD